MFSCKPDYEAAQKRIDAFWNHDDTDRPLTLINYRKPNHKPFPDKEYNNWRDKWLDFDYIAEETAHSMDGIVFFADSMPVFHPNLGPEIISAMAGCPYHFSETTTWTDPCVRDWAADGPKAVISMDSEYFKLLDKFTRVMLDAAKGKFIVGLSDFHPGGDHIAALRDPQVLAEDMYDNREYVIEKLKSSYPEYFAVYDHFVDLLKSHNMPIASWITLTSDTSMYIPSNDFSCMISKDMFDDVFLGGLIEECRHYKKSVYHLDGPDALRHLDSLLAIKELNAIQWVPGAGNEQVVPWIGVFKKILSAKKSVIAYPGNREELDLLIENLPARGLCVQMWAKDEAEAEDIMRVIERWGK